MRRSKLAFLAIAGAFIAASVLTVEKTQNGSFGISAETKAEAGGCCRISFPRISFPRISFPRISFPRISFPRISFPRFPRISFPRISFPRINIRVPQFISNIGRSIGNAFHGVVNVAKKIGEGVVNGVKTMAQGVVKIGQGVVQIAKGVGQVVGGVVTGAVKFTGGLIKAGGKLLKGDLKGAFNEVKAGAKAGFDAAKKGVTEGVKNIGQGVVKVADGVKDVAMGALQALGPIAEMAKDFLKKVFNDVLMKVIGGSIGQHIGKIAGVFSSSAGKLIEAISTLNRVLNAAQEILNAIQNPEEYVEKGKDWVAEKLTDLAWRVLETPIKKVVGYLMGALVGFVKHFITIPLTTALSSALAACTFGIGALAAPLIKWAIDQLFDLAINALTDKLAELGMGISGVRDFLKGKIIRPAIDLIYDKVMSFLRSKFPRVFAKAEELLKKVQGVAAQASGVISKVQDFTGKLQDALGKAKGMADNVQGFIATQRAQKMTSGPKISLKALIPKQLTNVVNIAKNAVNEVKAIIKDPKRIKQVVARVATEAKTLAKNAISQVIPMIKSAPKKIGDFIKEAAKQGLVEIKKKATEFVSNTITQVTGGGEQGGSGEESQAPADGADQAQADQQPAGDQAQASGDQGQPAGDQAQASGDQAQPAGDQAQASGDQAQPAGDQAQASGDQAQPAADQAQASGDQAQASGGDQAQTASADSSAAEDKPAPLPKVETDAPIVEAKPEADIEGMRAAVRTVYSLLVEDWKGGLDSTKKMAAAAKDLMPSVRRSLFQALILYRRNLHDAARLAYKVRVLALKYLYRDKIEENVDAINDALKSEGVGTAGVFQADVDASGDLRKQFHEARAALSRLCQNGERFINASALVATGNAAKVIGRVVKTFDKLVSKARQGLADAVTALKPVETASDEQDLENSAQAAEAGGR